MSLSLLDEFEIYARGRGWSDRYVGECLYTAALFERTADVALSTATALDVSRWLGTPGWAPNTRHVRHSYLKAVFTWAADRQHIGSNPMVLVPKPRQQVGVPKPLVDGQLERLLATRMHRRTRAMIMLEALAGLRNFEAAKVRGEDVDLENATIEVQGKGGRVDTLALHPVLVELARTMPRRGWWFPSNTTRPGEHITPRAVGDIIKRVMQRAGVDGHAHRLRHWYGTTLLEEGADLRTVQLLMRHTNIQTTTGYTRVSQTRRRAALSRISLPAAVPNAEAGVAQ